MATLSQLIARLASETESGADEKALQGIAAQRVHFPAPLDEFSRKDGRPVKIGAPYGNRGYGKPAWLKVWASWEDMQAYRHVQASLAALKGKKIPRAYEVALEYRWTPEQVLAETHFPVSSIFCSLDLFEVDVRKPRYTRAVRKHEIQCSLEEGFLRVQCSEGHPLREQFGGLGMLLCVRVPIPQELLEERDTTEMEFSLSVGGGISIREKKEEIPTMEVIVDASFWNQRVDEMVRAGCALVPCSWAYKYRNHEDLLLMFQNIVRIYDTHVRAYDAQFSAPSVSEVQMLLSQELELLGRWITAESPQEARAMHIDGVGVLQRLFCEYFKMGYPTFESLIMDFHRCCGQDISPNESFAVWKEKYLSGVISQQLLLEDHVVARFLVALKPSEVRMVPLWYLHQVLLKGYAVNQEPLLSSYRDHYTTTSFPYIKGDVTAPQIDSRSNLPTAGNVEEVGLKTRDIRSTGGTTYSVECKGGPGESQIRISFSTDFGNADPTVLALQQELCARIGITFSE